MEYCFLASLTAAKVEKGKTAILLEEEPGKFKNTRDNTSGPITHYWYSGNEEEILRSTIRHVLGVMARLRAEALGEKDYIPELASLMKRFELVKKD